MAAPSGTKVRFQEPGSHTEETASKSGALTRPKTVSSTNETFDTIASSPPISAPSKGVLKFGRKSRSLRRAILTQSLSQNSSETDPLISGGPSSNRDPEQQMNVSVEESRTDYVASCIICYQDSAMKFRNSVFIYIFQLLFFLIPVSAIVMGVLFAGKCPKNHLLPIAGAVVGACGVIYIAIWMFASYKMTKRHPLEPAPKTQKILFGMFCFVLLALTITDAVFVGLLSPTFDPTSAEYCSETFYTYAFYKEIVTAVYIILSVLLYLPGSRDALCCVDPTTELPYRTCDMSCWWPYTIDD